MWFSTMGRYDNGTFSFVDRDLLKQQLGWVDSVVSGKGLLCGGGIPTLAIRVLFCSFLSLRN